MRTILLALIRAYMQDGSKDCDASSNITRSKSFGICGLLTDARVTNHNFLLLK